MAALRGVAALVAILGLVCCSSLAAASIEQQHAFDDALLLDDAQPQAVPNRRGSRTLTQAFDALETFDDADIQTGVPGDVLYGGYGYYGATPSPVPTAEPTPAPTYTPSTTATPSPTKPPIGANQVSMRFLAKFPVVSGTAEEVVSNATKLQAFKDGFAQACAAGLGLASWQEQIKFVSVYSASARHARRLQQSGGAVASDYLVVLPKDTSSTVLAQIREKSLNDPAALFSSFAAANGLSTPTMTLLEDVPASSGPGSGSSTGTPPPTISTPSPSPTKAPGSSAGRTTMSVGMTLLALAGSTMLLGLLF